MTSTSLSTLAGSPPLLEIIERLRLKFIKMKRDEELRASFDHLLQTALTQRRLAQADNRPYPEARALILLGESGTGKTRSLHQMFTAHPDLKGYDHLGGECPLVSVSAPSPCTLKQLGREALHKLGYPIARDSKEYLVWETVRRKLQSANVLVVHFDEMQHVIQNANILEVGKVANTLKDLMINPTWPVSLIISGMPALQSFIEADPQLMRRSQFIKFRSLDAAPEGAAIAQVIAQLANMAKLSPCFASDARLEARLIHAANYQFGRAIQQIISAISHALMRQSAFLTIEDFANAFTARTGNSVRANPFVIHNWRDLDPTKVLQDNIPSQSQVLLEPQPKPKPRTPQRGKGRGW